MRQEIEETRALKALADRVWTRMGAPRRPTRQDIERVLRVLMADDSQAIRVPMGGRGGQSD